jgi:hypothetical protein
MLVVVGCAAAGMLAAAAVMTLLGDAEAAGPGLGGNVALVLFAVMNANRPYRRYWAPALFFLGLTGASGAALALLPAAEHFVSPSTVVRFAIDGLHVVVELGAVGMTAFAWSTAGRSVGGARWSMTTLTLLALLQLGEAASLALVGPTGDVWTFASQLLFASWLLATVLGLTRRLGGPLATRPIGKPRYLPAQPTDMLREIGRHGDRVR